VARVITPPDHSVQSMVTLVQEIIQA